MKQYNETSQDKMKYDSEILSNNIIDYNLNNIRSEQGLVFPYDPNIKPQKLSGDISKGDLVNRNSEVLNITRKLSNDINDKWTPDKFVEEDQQLEDGLFTIRNTYLDEGGIKINELTKNRWINLYNDPQENVIEPFKKNGINTHLELIDNHNC